MNIKRVMTPIIRFVQRKLALLQKPLASEVVKIKP